MNRSIPPQTSLGLRLLGVVALLVTCSPLGWAQDRLQTMNIVFPNGAFHQNGGPVINMKNTTLFSPNAVGDGVTDDTAAFVAMMDYIKNRLVATSKADPRITIYLPSGTYLVSDTIIHTGSISGGFSYLRLVGQNRANTTIRLKNNSTGFGAGQSKPVITWTKYWESYQGNVMWGNQLRNITIDTGSGNPGAVGVAFFGANGCSIDNVTIRSGDGFGHTGLLFPGWSVQGHFCDISVEGFDYGIRATDQRETNPTLEYVTLSGQKIAGVSFSRVAGCIRKLKSTNTVPAIDIQGLGTHAVVVDSDLLGGSSANGAILVSDTTKQQLFARNVNVAGYGSSIKENGSAVFSGYIPEYVSGSVFSFGSTTPPLTINLPVVEAQLVPWESNPANWASPEDYTGTDAQKIQAALNSGKPAVLIPKAYNASGATLTVPATVKQIEFLHQVISGAALNVNAASSNDLWLEHPQKNLTVQVSAQRNIRSRFGSINFKVTTTSPVIADLQTMATLGNGAAADFCPANVKMYLRSPNQEQTSTTNFSVNGGLMWVFGWKTERQQRAFEAKSGAVLEVLGGYQNFAGAPDGGFPVLLNDNSNVSYIGTNHMSNNYQQGIWEVRSGTTSKMLNSTFPRRDCGSGAGNYFVPLYVGYDPAQLPGVIQNSGFETPAVSTYQYNPSGGKWTFTGNAGVQKNGSAFGAAAAPDGVQTAFLQHSGSAGSMSQTVRLRAGSYSLSLKAARRNTQVQPIQVRVDGVAVGSPITPAGSAFAAYTTVPFTVTAGDHVISLETTATTGDLTTFVDTVRLNSQLPNGGFESPAVTTLQYNPAGANWTFAGNSGVQRNGSAFGAAAAPEGVQAAFLQHGTTGGGGSLSQAVNLTAGTYALSFKAARRNTQVQPIQVKVDGVAVGSPITPASSTYATYNSANFTVTDGNHVISLETTATGGDLTSFVDAIMLMPQ